MSFVIYCNSCFETQSQNQRKFVITNCSHVFCESCIANSNNFCRVCQIQCKMLDINKDMPSDVKMFLEHNSIQRMTLNIQKIQSFQKNQSQAFWEKTRPYSIQYRKYKDYLNKITESKKHYVAKARAEQEIMARLKVAYRDNIITPDLFQLGNAKGSVTNISLVTSTPSNHSSPHAPSIRSSSSMSNAGSNVKSLLLPQNLTRLQVQSSPTSSKSSNHARFQAQPPSTPSNYAGFQVQPSPSTRPNVYHEARKNLLESTLRHMQMTSQSNYQSKRFQPMKKM